jgi:hypothetical protein
MIQIDGPRSSVRVQIKRGILRKAQVDTSRAGMDYPFPCGLSVSLDVAAARLCLQRAVNVAKFQAAGTGFRLY